jgi:uncharacterized protein with NRDE domain
MCLIAIAYRASARYPLVVAANRDESHARPSAAAAWWRDEPRVLGGRDLEAGGTWLAIDRCGRFGAVTNLRDEQSSRALRDERRGEGARPDEQNGRVTRDGSSSTGRPSRGLLVSRFLTAGMTAAAFDAALDAEAQRYAPFNLLLCDARELVYASNRAAGRSLDAGIHAFSNTTGASWPKIERARQGLERILETGVTGDALLAMLAERAAPSDSDPRRSGLFQLDPVWGTRSSTAVLIGDDGRARLIERRFDAMGRRIGEDVFEFELEDAC